MRLHPLILVLLALSSLSFPSHAAAQAADSATTVGWLRRLCPGQAVMVSTTLRERVAGECGGLRDERLLLRQDAGERVLPLAGLDSVWVRQPGTRSGALTGAAVGGTVFGTLGVLFTLFFCEFHCRQEYLRYGLGGMAAGAFTGAGVGGLLGEERTVWVRVHPR